MNGWGKQDSGLEEMRPGCELRLNPTEGGLSCSQRGALEYVTPRTVLTWGARSHTSAPVIGWSRAAQDGALWFFIVTGQVALVA